jgi:AcrR family transcriptional regulator
MSPSARRTELVAAARAVLTGPDDAAVAVADIAQAAGVSKALLYRYFPNGRAELVAAVVDDLVHELLERVHRAAAMPFSPEACLEQLLAAVFAFFDAQPGAYRLLVRPTTDATPDGGAARAAQVALVAAVSGLMAEASAPPADIVTSATGLVGFVLATVERCLAGEVPAERAWQLSCRCARLLTADG